MLESIADLRFQVDLGNLAVGIGTMLVALVTYLNVRAIKSQRVSDSGKEWIEDLRKHLAEFAELCYSVRSTDEIVKQAEIDRDAVHASKMTDALRERTARLYYVHRYIEMMIDREEGRHRALLHRMQEMVEEALGRKPAGDADIQSFLVLAREALKAEWKRVSNQ